VQQAVVSVSSRSRDDEFDSLVGPYLEAGYRTALAILRDPDEAHDAVQEAALKAWRRLGQLRDGRSSRAWFLAIVANQCRSTRRGRWWSVVRLPQIERVSEDIDAGTTDLGRALSRLTAEDRLPLFLHFYLHMPLEEVGAVLGISAAGAKTRVYRAAKKLRPDLELT
jgi:RNA polymerase sigma-70 factor, ECF subfamily